jgi:hypothetical protein
MKCSEYIIFSIRIKPGFMHWNLPLAFQLQQQGSRSNIRSNQTRDELLSAPILAQNQHHSRASTSSVRKKACFATINRILNKPEHALTKSSPYARDPGSRTSLQGCGTRNLTTAQSTNCSASWEILNRTLYNRMSRSYHQRTPSPNDRT